MPQFNKNIVHELCKEYTFRTFNFEKGSPEEFLESYQSNYKKLAKLASDKNFESLDSSASVLLSKKNYPHL